MAQTNRHTDKPTDMATFRPTEPSRAELVKISSIKIGTNEQNTKI